MSPAIRAPEGFVAEEAGRGRVLLARREVVALLRRAGLGEPAGWTSGQAATHGSGRGATSRVELDDGSLLRLKQLLRGGWIGGLWRGRFPGTGRLIDNLRIPAEAARRGVPTPAAPAMLLVEGPRGLFRAWIATEEIAAAVDLAALVRGGTPPTRGEWSDVLQTVRRMHDVGLDHRDLNLGNLLLRRGAGERRTFVIDLDGARLHRGPLGFSSRLRALRRLERSYVKTGAAGPAAEEVRRTIYAGYAGEDDALAARLDRRRLGGRLRILFHRLGWWGGAGSARAPRG